MIVPSDADYKATKDIKKRLVVLQEPFRTLVKEVSEHFGVAVLNAIYEVLSNPPLRRLMIVLEREHDALGFRDLNGNFDHEKQARVRTIFENVLARGLFGRYDSNNLFVAFVAFEPVARIEAVDRVTNKQLETWKRQLDDPNLWLIRICFASATVFYFTELQAQAARQSGMGDVLSAGFYNIVRSYDEFGFLTENPPTVEIDSKENFDTKFKGNWFYYDH